MNLVYDQQWLNAGMKGRERPKLNLAPVGRCGRGREGGRWRASVALLSSLCSVFFYGRHVSLITSFFIQEYEWLTTAKKGNLKKWNRKNVQLHLSLSSSELRFTNFLIQSHVKLKHTILFLLYIGMQGIYIGQGEDKMCCYSSIIIIFILLYLLL